MEAEIPEALRDLLALSLVPGVGPQRAALLLAHFGSPGAVLQATQQQLLAIRGVGAKIATDIRAARSGTYFTEELELIRQHGVQIAGLRGEGYPARLAEIPDPPPILYIRGTLTPADARAVAIVGSRRCTTYGQRITEKLAEGLAKAGYVVVSGLARGIDGFAHRAALNAGGRTLAVLAGGLSKIYPPEHDQLAEQVATAGALLCEVPMRSQPLPTMFHARNRIISGLVLGVVIIEANDRSGALITARHAADQGRDVFVVPANVDSLASSGSLNLIRLGARVIRGIDDLLEDLQGFGSTPSPATDKAEASATPARSEPVAAPPPTLSAAEQKLWDYLTEQRHIDQIAAETGLSMSELSKMMMLLEMKRVIRRLPGNWYERR